MRWAATYLPMAAAGMGLFAARFRFGPFSPTAVAITRHPATLAGVHGPYPLSQSYQVATVKKYMKSVVVVLGRRYYLWSVVFV